MTFYCIEILFSRLDAYNNAELKRHQFINCTGNKIKQLRETLIFEGLQVQTVSLTEWEIILPWNIKTITVYRQEKFFGNQHSDLKQTVFDYPEGETQKVK